MRAALAHRVGEMAASLAATENLFDAGIASIDLVVALTRLARELDVEVAQPVPLAEACASIATIVSYLRRNSRLAVAADETAP